MSSIPSTPITADELRRSEAVHIARYTLSGKNAERWKALFDRMIEDRQNQQVLCKDVGGRKVGTIYQQCCDALAWLSRSHPDHSAKYKLFKSSIRIRRGSDRIILYFPDTVENVILNAGRIADDPTTAPVDWKAHFQQWLTTATEGELYDSRKEFPALVLSPADKEWLMQLLAGVDGCEVDSQVDYVRVAR